MGDHSRDRRGFFTFATNTVKSQKRRNRASIKCFWGKKLEKIYNRIPEASLIVTDFTISVHGSSCKCNSLFLSFSVYFLTSLPTLWMPVNRRESKGTRIIRLKQRQWHEIPDTETAKSTTIILTFGCIFGRISGFFWYHVYGSNIQNRYPAAHPVSLISGASH